MFSCSGLKGICAGHRKPQILKKLAEERESTFWSEATEGAEYAWKIETQKK